MDDKLYDTIIIGAGPAGLTAAIYAARYRLDTLVLGSNIGGTANLAHYLENWPGFKGSGMKLLQDFKEHVESFGVPIIPEDVKLIEKKEDIFIISTEKETYKAYTIILAMGTKRRKLHVSGEEKFFGKGVSYCATCDCMFFKDQIVAVVGGSDGAAMAAQILSQHAKKVYIIYRKDALRAEPARVEDLENTSNVEFIFNTAVVEIMGDKSLKKVKFDTGKELELDGLFIEIGGIPLTTIAKELELKLSENKRIVVDSAMKTNMPGVFAAGDITTGSNGFNQIVTAASEGAISALEAFRLVKTKKRGA